jgi:hypothetical protein
VPTGFWDSLNSAARFLEWMQPKRVLDIGVGNGRMGFLAREYGDKEGIERWRPGSQIVDGIEGYEPYLGPIQEAIYDEILVGDAIDVLAKIDGHYDIALAADILEHFGRDDAPRFLDLAQQVSDVLLVSTPNFDMPQVSEENPLENHRSFWQRDALTEAGAHLVLSTELSVFALFGERRIIDEYASQIRPTTSWKDWILPPEVKRVLREQWARHRF